MIRLQFGAFKLCDIFAVKNNLSACRLIHTDQCSAQRRFTAAGLAHKTKCLTFSDLECNTVYRLDCLLLTAKEILDREMLLQVFCLQQDLIILFCHRLFPPYPLHLILLP